MKRILLILATFTLTITALHAQVPPIPGIDPDVSAAVQTALPPQYAAYGSLILVVGMILGRAFTALRNNGGLVGIYNAIVHGTNTAAKLLLISGLCLLTIPSCQTVKKIGAALSTPKAKQIEVGLANLGLQAAVAKGIINTGDVVLIKDATALITPAIESTTLPPPALPAVTSGK